MGKSMSVCSSVFVWGWEEHVGWQFSHPEPEGGLELSSR